MGAVLYRPVGVKIVVAPFEPRAVLVTAGTEYLAVRAPVAGA
jgi:hypothetical protein